MKRLIHLMLCFFGLHDWTRPRPLYQDWKNNPLIFKHQCTRCGFEEIYLVPQQRPPIR